jgi:hypothetical protein
LATAITRQGSGRIKDQETLRELQDTHPKWTYDKNTPPPKKKKTPKPQGNKKDAAVQENQFSSFVRIRHLFNQF